MPVATAIKMAVVAGDSKRRKNKIKHVSFAALFYYTGNIIQGVIKLNKQKKESYLTIHLIILLNRLFRIILLYLN